mmetsp:Transcript_18592/g.53742  ORF Transcript_18592/g.53742 Transcript_18592/m.53742 type:complete len:203 (+) Transcript_18592:2718-3326(+)
MPRLPGVLIAPGNSMAGARMSWPPLPGTWTRCPATPAPLATRSPRPLPLSAACPRTPTPQPGERQRAPRASARRRSCSQRLCAAASAPRRSRSTACRRLCSKSWPTSGSRRRPPRQRTTSFGPTQPMRGAAPPSSWHRNALLRRSGTPWRRVLPAAPWPTRCRRADVQRSGRWQWSRTSRQARRRRWRPIGARSGTPWRRSL